MTFVIRAFDILNKNTEISTFIMMISRNDSENFLD